MSMTKKLQVSYSGPNMTNFPQILYTEWNSENLTIAQPAMKQQLQHDAVSRFWDAPRAPSIFLAIHSKVLWRISPAVIMALWTKSTQTVNVNRCTPPYLDNHRSSATSTRIFLCSAARGDLVVYPEQDYNSATRHFVWLVQSPGTVSHWTFVGHLSYITNVQKHAQDIFSHVPTSPTNCFTQYEQRPLYGTLVVTLAMLVRLINYRFIIIIIITY